MRLSHIGLVLALSFAGASCYSPSLQSCTVECSTEGTCPSGTSCGTDNFCHADPGESCIGAHDGGGIVDGKLGVDARPGTPDAKGGAIDAPVTIDAPTVRDAPVHFDAAPVLDARPTFDAAQQCVDEGEPNDTCPGEAIGPVLEGSTLTLDNRTIYPVGDVDVFGAVFVPLKGCSNATSYAVRVALAPPPFTTLRLRRFHADDTCQGSTTNVGLSFCAPISAPCGMGIPLIPPMNFKIDGAQGVSSCTPYVLSITLCAAGSTCDNCITF
jgi:hypothetical protein